jgi:flagellin
VGSTNLGNATLGYLNTIRSVGSNSVVAGNYVNAERILVEAINQVAVIRGRLGGLQRNQIETNINSQRIALENVQAAESAIRDADIATEVAAMTRSQILVQSTTSILGLANQIPQNALALLGG